MIQQCNEFTKIKVIVKEKKTKMVKIIVTNRYYRKANIQVYSNGVLASTCLAMHG